EGRFGARHGDRLAALLLDEVSPVASDRDGQPQLVVLHRVREARKNQAAPREEAEAIDAGVTAADHSECVDLPTCGRVAVIQQLVRKEVSAAAYAMANRATVRRLVAQIIELPGVIPRADGNLALVGVESRTSPDA